MFLVSAKGSSATSEGASGALQASDFVLLMSHGYIEECSNPRNKGATEKQFCTVLSSALRSFTSALRYGGK